MHETAQSAAAGDGRFGEQRLVRPNTGVLHRMVHYSFGAPDPANFLHHLYLRKALASLSSFKPNRILDAGCGPGDHSIWLARTFPDAQVIARDILAESVSSLAESARRLGITNLTVEQTDLRSMAEDAAFDLIVSIDVLEHIPERMLVLQRLRRALSPGGSAFLHVPTVRTRPVPFAGLLGEFLAWGVEEHTAQEVTSEEFVESIRNAGFNIIHAQQTFGYWTGELATSLFAIPYRKTPLNRLAQLALAPVCRLLAYADLRSWDATRYAVGVLATT